MSKRAYVIFIVCMTILLLLGILALYLGIVDAYTVKLTTI